jgi:hypothetical protein
MDHQDTHTEAHSPDEADGSVRRRRLQQAKRWEAEAKVLAAHVAELQAGRKRRGARTERPSDRGRGNRAPGDRTSRS